MRKNIIQTFHPFDGEHCETTTTGSLLQHLDIQLSEAMLFGLGEGLGYIFWNMKMMDFPFIGGRIKPDTLTANLAKNLNLNLEVQETSSVKKAWQNVQEKIDKNIPVGLKLDCYHLEYFTNKIHFAGHYVTMYGYDEQFAYLLDTKQQGGQVKTSLKSLALARDEKGPMSSKNKSYTICKKSEAFILEEVIVKAIKNNAKDYLNPPIKNIGYKGILKTSVEIKKWFHASKDKEGDFKTTAMLMEKAGTGGALFRNLYRDFLKESAALLQSDVLLEASSEFTKIAILWTEVAFLLDEAGKTSDEKYIHKASDILVELSKKEKKTMESLEKL